MTASQPQRVEVTPKSLTGLKDTRGESIRRQLSSDHGLEISEVRSITGYLVKGNFNETHHEKMISDLFCDPIIEHGVVNQQ
ncbi:MAG TPA: hypothetical protein EYN58_06390, partial [Candidatus Poseidoniales archaeon]|nr:hypothetical protein [Candidatus Poseidoniales archaeon]